MNSLQNTKILVLAFVLAAPLSVAMIFFNSGLTHAANVNANSAAVVPANLDASGIVTLFVNGATGNYTQPESTIERYGDTEPTGGAELSVNPSLRGGEVDNHIIPTELIPTDSRSLECVYKDSGSTRMRFDLFVTFNASTTGQYTIKWNNKKFATKWTGLIDLPKPESTAHAKFRAWTYHPWAENGQPAPKVAATLQGYNTDNPITVWEHNEIGRTTTGISHDGGAQILDDPDVAGDPAGLVKTFVVNYDSTGSKTFNCHTAVEVVINHDVSAGWSSGSDPTYISRTKDPNTPGSSWSIYGWELYVSVTKP